MYELDVVVTAYNNEDYILNTLNSIFDQWSGNFKLTIAYDEGSSDDTLKICEEFAEGMDFVEIYKREHCFVGEMRNEVAKRSDSKYITFIDGDDMVAPGAISKMLRTAKEKNVDTVIGQMMLFYPGGKTKIMQPFKYSEDCSYRVCTTCMHPVLFTRELYLKELYCRPNVKTHEDRIGGYLIPSAGTYAVINEVLYYYTVSPVSSIRNKKGRIKMFWDIITIWEELNKERYRFSEGEWELIREDLEWSAISPFFFFQYTEKKYDVDTILNMFVAINKHFPGWQNNKVLKSIEKGNFLVRRYVKLLKKNKVNEELLNFIYSNKMKIIDIGTEIYALGGMKGWLAAKLARKN